MAEPTQSRRSALQAIGLFLAAGAGLWRFLTPRAGSVRRARKTIAVAADDVPADGALVLPDSGVAIVREGQILLGIELGCTHLGCTVKATSTGFACPCHGSRFSGRGECIVGPAQHALHRLHVDEENGIVRVATGREAHAAVPRSPRAEVGIGRA